MRVLFLIAVLPLCAMDRNHFRHRFETTADAGVPVAVEFAAPLGFHPDSVRVRREGATDLLGAKTEWRAPRVRVSFVSAGTGAYLITYDEGVKGETERRVEPAMIGTGDRVTFGRAGVRGRLAVGLWAHPAPVDVDGDGDMDLIVGCVDRPYNGTYLFRNIGTLETPLFDRAEWLGPGKKDLVAADFNGDGKTDLVYSGGYFDDVRTNLLRNPVAVSLKRNYWISRDDLWYPVDWDRDGKIDLLAGTSDWRDYGWDDAFDEQGNWTRGKLHGYVWFHRNLGTNDQPEYAEGVRLQAGGVEIDLYGSPSPNPVDWFGRGRWDLIGGSFLDSLTLFENSGARLKEGRLLEAEGRPIRMDLCMIQPRVVDWNPARGPSLLVAEEDGTVSLFENTAAKGSPPSLKGEVKLQQLDPFLKSGALSRPVAFDWNGDGRLDIISGNSAGYLQFFENVGDKNGPAFADRGYLQAEGRAIRRTAGANGSIQGPAEEKWGYSNPSVADWDLDGLPDILVNDILGEVVWHRNIGSRGNPALAPAAPVEVDWPGAPPKPEWNWKPVRGKQLVTQWRTTPKVMDWDQDGLPDLVMLNHQGYLCLYRRSRIGGQLRLGPPERIFVTETGRFLNLANGRAGSSGRRKIELADWDGDGDPDLVTDSDEGPVWYENTGSRRRPVMVRRGTLVSAKLAGHNPTPNLADWNGDGKLDLLIGAEDGFFYYFDGRYLQHSAR